MIYSRQELIDRVNAKDIKFFANFRWGSSKGENKCSTIWELCWGDGNEIQVAMEFTNENLIILLEGTYSSHDETDWYDVSFGVPFEFRETRYKPATQADLRDMKINDILN
jgi:hypothetical protein